MSSLDTITVSGMTFETACDSTWIKSVSELKANQSVALQSELLEFILPEYVNTDPDPLCPPVLKVEVKDASCTSIQAEFENAEDLMQTLSNKELKTKFLNILELQNYDHAVEWSTDLKTFSLCFNISTLYNSTTVSGQLTVFADCSETISKVANSFAPIEQVYNDTIKKMVQIKMSSLFVNADEVYCPIISLSLM